MPRTKWFSVKFVALENEVVSYQIHSIREQSGFISNL